MTITLAKKLAREEAVGRKVDMIVVEYCGRSFVPVRAACLAGDLCPSKATGFRRVVCGFAACDGREHQGF